MVLWNITHKEFDLKKGCQGRTVMLKSKKRVNPIKQNHLLQRHFARGSMASVAEAERGA